MSKNATEPSTEIITHLLFWAGGFFVVGIFFFFFFLKHHELDEKGVGEVLVNRFGRKREPA